MVKVSQSEVNAKYPFGLIKEPVVARLKKLVEGIESGALLVQGFDQLTESKTEDFEFESIKITFCGVLPDEA